MRLINVHDYSMKEFYGHNIPAYAILSHLWGDDEVLLSDMKSIKQNEASAKGGFAKIELCCKQAKLDGWDWAWVDTCCIDKTSSAELAEAIYSMFQWYSRAMICYAYLADVAWDGDRGGEDEKMFHEVQRSRWFKRGWTLQELIAPKEVRFFDKSWSFLGSKSSWAPFLEETTRIPQSVLGNAAAMRDIPVGQRMIWAFDRETTREEDLAYCLLGIFDINMPLLYGEGPRAFWRLQEEIMKHEDDHTLFLWDLLADSEFDYGQDSLRGGLLARSPRNFRSCPKMSIRKIPPECPWPLVSNRGVQIGFHLKTLPQDSWSLVGLDNGRHNWVEIRSVQLAALCCQIDDSSNLQPWPLGSPPGETVVALVLWQPAEAGPGVFHRYPGRYVKVRVSEVMQCWKLTSCLILNPSPPKGGIHCYGGLHIGQGEYKTRLVDKHETSSGGKYLLSTAHLKGVLHTVIRYEYDNSTNILHAGRLPSWPPNETTAKKRFRAGEVTMEAPMAEAAITRPGPGPVMRNVWVFEDESLELVLTVSNEARRDGSKELLGGLTVSGTLTKLIVTFRPIRR